MKVLKSIVKTWLTKEWQIVMAGGRNYRWIGLRSDGSLWEVVCQFEGDKDKAEAILDGFLCNDKP